MVAVVIVESLACRSEESIAGIQPDVAEPRPRYDILRGIQDIRVAHAAWKCLGDQPVRRVNFETRESADTIRHLQ